MIILGYDRGERGELYLWQLFRDASEHMIVEVPGLGEVFHVVRSLVLATPLLGFHQVSPVRLKYHNVTAKKWSQLAVYS